MGHNLDFLRRRHRLPLPPLRLFWALRGTTVRQVSGEGAMLWMTQLVKERRDAGGVRWHRGQVT